MTQTAPRYSDRIRRRPIALGKPLVAQVAPVAFRTLLEELDYFTIDGIVQWQTDQFLRSVSNLPLTTER